MIVYSVSEYDIKIVEKEAKEVTPKYVILSSGIRVERDGSSTKYYLTKEEAVVALIRREEYAIERAKERIKKAKGNLTKIKKEIVSIFFKK